MSRPVDGRRLAGAIAGGLVAGVGISAMLMRSERRSSEPSEIANIKRAGLAKLGREVPSQEQLPDTREQVVIQGGHLLLSAAAGAAYALTTECYAALLPGGIAFGLAFYGAMHWIVGPTLGLKSPEWRSDRTTLVMHTVNHVGFGLVTAAGAALAGHGSKLRDPT